MTALLTALTLTQALVVLADGRPGEAQAALEHLDDCVSLGAAQLDNLRDPRVAERTLRGASSSWRSHLLIGIALAKEVPGAFVLRKLSLAGEVQRELTLAAALGPRQVAAHEALFGFFLHAPGFAGGGRDKARAEAEVLAKLDTFAGLLAQAQLDGDYRLAASEARTSEQIAALARISKDPARFAAALEARPQDARLRRDLSEILAELGQTGRSRHMLAEACQIDPLYESACHPR
ncbi:MAG TPA: hypothetical protein VH083_16625 [Myxococcales bacterium]|nr:hypothetical protein [Myxococcales bacterium]